MRGLEVEARSGARLEARSIVRGKRLDFEAQDGARSQEAGSVRHKSLEIGSRGELADAIKQQSSQLEKSGAVIEKVWDKASLQSYVEGKAKQAQRETHDPYAGDDARHSAARELELRRELNRGSVKVLYPEAQIEYADAAGRKQRLSISVAEESRSAKGQRRREEARQRHAERSCERGERAREKDQGRERIPFDQRKRQAVTDVATYRVVSVKDLVDERFGGNAYRSPQRHQ